MTLYIARGKLGLAIWRHLAGLYGLLEEKMNSDVVTRNGEYLDNHRAIDEIIDSCPPPLTEEQWDDIMSREEEVVFDHEQELIDEYNDDEPAVPVKLSDCDCSGLGIMGISYLSVALMELNGRAL